MNDWDDFVSSNVRGDVHPIAFTDGSVLNNGSKRHDSPTGSAAVIGWPSESGIRTWKAHVEHGDNGTNQTAELVALCLAVEHCDSYYMTVVSDSEYALNCAAGIFNKRANLDLWKRFYKAAVGRYVRFIWVRGHQNIPLNELADELARYALDYRDEVDAEEIAIIVAATRKEQLFSSKLQNCRLVADYTLMPESPI